MSQHSWPILSGSPPTHVPFPVQEGDVIITSVPNGYIIKTVSYSGTSEVRVAEEVESMVSVVKQLLVERKLK